MNLKTFLAAFVVLLDSAHTARILGVVPSTSYSHQVVFQPIWRELSLRGHQVVTITTDPINDPKLINLTEISVRSAYDIWNKQAARVSTLSWYESLSLFFEIRGDISDHILSNDGVQQLIKNETEHFDLVILEVNFLLSFAAFSERFKAPLVICTSTDAVIDLHHMVGNPIHPVLYPNFMLRVHYDILFRERIMSVLFQTLMAVFQRSLNEPEDVIVKKFFGDGYPSVTELLSRTSLVLSNSNPILHKVKPLLPTIIEFGGGMPSYTSKPLTKSLMDTLDAAQDGFIYFSLGSNIKSTFLTEDRREIIMKTFAELPFTVLWKYEDDVLPNQPKNVIISKWFPQQNVLKHPNIKLFITQGGLQSMDEAIYSQVPLLIVPMFSDQFLNAHRAVAKGFAQTLDLMALTQESFGSTILELINNPKYKNRLKELVKLAEDQPMSGLDKALWWIEYVIRHKGTAHLRSPYLDLPTYQYYYLDVIAFFSFVILVLLGVVFICIKLIRRLLSKIFLRIFKLKKT